MAGYYSEGDITSDVVRGMRITQSVSGWAHCYFSGWKCRNIGFHEKKTYDDPKNDPLRHFKPQEVTRAKLRVFFLGQFVFFFPRRKKEERRKV